MTDTLPGLLAERLARIPEVQAVALGGSQATGQADAASDIDLYVYSDAPVPTASRAAIAARRGDPVEIDNRFWETGDEWDEVATGVHVDIVYRDLAAVREGLAQVLDHHVASMGYTTCIWHNVLTSRSLFDRSGRFAELQGIARRPYPEELAQAIVAWNLPLIRDSFGAFGRQLIKAARRGDPVAMNHRASALLASYFDVVFAANREPHPGEKRLLSLAAALPHPPVGMTTDVLTLLGTSDEVDLAAAVASLADNLTDLLKERGLLPRAARRSD